MTIRRARLAVVAALALALSGAGVVAAQKVDTAVAATAQCGALTQGEVLSTNETLYSCNGAYRLVLQGDSNLVMYGPGDAVLWASGTQDAFLTQLAMQADGNLVLTYVGTPRWATMTHGNPGAFLQVQDDGNLVIYDAAHTPLWVKGGGATFSQCVELSPGENNAGFFNTNTSYATESEFYDVAGRRVLISLNGSGNCDIIGQRFVRGEAQMWDGTATVTAYLQRVVDGRVENIPGTEVTKTNSGFFDAAFSNISNVPSQTVRACGRFEFDGIVHDQCTNWSTVPH